MAKKLGILAGIMVGALAVLLIVVGMQPALFQVSRATEIQTPPEIVFAILNDLHQGARWSPYDGKDPAMKKTFSGPETGPGASYAWQGNDEVGEGQLTITESKPNELVAMDLDFTRPMVCSNRVRYELKPTTGGTQVAWIMEGENNFIGKAFCLFMDMDSMVGKDFEQGLKNLNEVALADAAASKSLNSASPEAPAAAPAKPVP